MKKKSGMLNRFFLMSACLVLILIACDKENSVEAIVEMFVRSQQIFASASTLQIGLGDFDADGDLDAVFSNMGEINSTVWINDGTGRFTDSGQRLTQWGHGVGVGDLDRDGDLDLFITCASYDHRSRVYFNDGDGIFADSGQDLGDSAWSGNGVSLIDADTDGDLDVYVTYYEQPDKIYHNNGSSEFTDSGLTIPEHATFGDLDGDGDVDIFVKEYNTGYKTMLNNGQGNFTNHWQVAHTEVINGAVTFGDLDGDNDLDAFICNGDNSGHNYPSAVLLNDGAGRFSDSGQALMVTSFGRVGLGDFDGNGSLDAFISSFGSPNQVWMNDGTGQFTDSGLRMSGVINDNTTHVSLGDLDNDGDLDVFVANFVEGRNEIWFNEMR